MECCPECGSTDITMRYGGKLGRLMVCKKCDWQGRVTVDFPDESLKKMKEIEKAKKLEKKNEKIREKNKKTGEDVWEVLLTGLYFQPHH